MEIIRGDTKEISVTITKNGEPYVPLGEKVVFTVKKDYEEDSPILIQHDVVNGKVIITHNDTVNLEYGKYVYDVRVYRPDLSEVQTPIIGTLKIAKVVNNDLKKEVVI